MFKRGLSEPFMDALGALAAGPGWWREVLDDPTLIIAVRDEYLNVYWQGQSLFRVEHTGGAVRASTHPKYLLDPDMSRAVPFDGTRFALPPVAAALTAEWTPGVTLKKMKKAAGLYAGREKRAAHDIVLQNPSVLDVEIAVRRETLADDQDRDIPRIDLLSLEPDGEAWRLAFWEVKLFANKELRAQAPAQPKVIGQIEDYRRILEAERDGIVDSYRIVAANLAAIARMRGTEPASAIGSIAEQPHRLVLGTPPDVGLIITSFDGDQRDGTLWQPHRDLLMGHLHGGRARFVGDPKRVKL